MCLVVRTEEPSQHKETQEDTINNCHKVINTAIHSNTMNPTQYHRNVLLKQYLFRIHKFVPDEASLNGQNHTNGIFQLFVRI